MTRVRQAGFGKTELAAVKVLLGSHAQDVPARFGGLGLG